ncbi:MAG: hypothetical protein KAV87_46675 [Desulfobacteraceae bacterium]|nr:hypothetical protein [Desulfobacteraceae bacterium]
MEKIKFRIADGTECQGYLFTWEDLSFGLTRSRAVSSNHWSVIELQTGCSVTGKQPSTRKEAIREALELLNSKGVQAVKKRLKEIFVEQGNTKVGPKIKTAHCTSPDNRLKTLCGRVKKEYCLPLKYFKYAKRPCEKCQRLAKKRKAG